jgi:outer membrane protein assembly factor BamB
MAASTGDTHFIKINLTTGVEQWNMKLACTGTCTHTENDFILSSDATQVYAWFRYSNASNGQCMFMTFAYSDGSIIGSRYRLSEECTLNERLIEQSGSIYFQYQRAVNGKAIIGAYDKTTSTFGTIYNFSQWGRLGRTGPGSL